jgi:type III pantothenate kinase
MAVDVGNTQTVLGLFEGDEARGRWRIATEAQRTSDELAVVFAGLLGLKGLRLQEVSAMIVSSVVPGLTRSYRHLAEDVLGVPFYLVNAGMETGLKNRYDDPAAVGADRIVNAVAAGRYYGFPAIIVDIGTATTVEAVDGEANYLGGAIMTGLYVALDALVARTAKLPSVDLEEEAPSAIATNTPDSIRSGFVYGYAGAIDALVRRSREELGEEDVRVVATGGPASVIVRHCREIETFDPDLTLKGLRVLHEMNGSTPLR